ncbi:jg3767, partial [Pararge aegeria aegeria]
MYGEQRKTSQGIQGAGHPATCRPVSINLSSVIKPQAPVITPDELCHKKLYLLSGRDKHGDSSSPDELCHKK